MNNQHPMTNPAPHPMTNPAPQPATHPAPPRLIDTHCHLYLDQFDEDLEEVLERAVAAGITDILLPAITMDSQPAMDTLAERTKRANVPGLRLHKMGGVHPCDVPTDESELQQIEKVLPELCKSDDIVGVGETGLDYYWSKDAISEQKRMLHLHCELAKSTRKPIVLHNRESTEDLLDLIEQEQDGRLTGVWHCFTGTLEQGRRAIDLGLHLGIGGVVTFKNAGMDRVVCDLPLEWMMLETDAPYLAPVPHRGKRNEPSFAALTLQKLAELKGIQQEEAADITTRNALRLFGLE